MLILANDFLSLTVSPHGARMASLRLADGAEVLLSPGDGGAASAGANYIGAAVGRFANRLRPFRLDDVVYRPLVNEGSHTLHGGPRGFSSRMWDVVFHAPREAVLRLISEDGDQGFPGRVETELRIHLDGPSARTSFLAQTSAPTPINLTMHPYFRLGGETIGTHTLTLRAEGVVAVDDAQLPTGELLPLIGGALDLSEGGELGPRIAALRHGLDHCYLTPDGCEAVLAHPPSGRRLTVSSDAPAVQVYTGAALSAPHRPFSGVAIEPQSPPDAPNHPALGATILRPGTTYRRTITYRFG